MPRVVVQVSAISTSLWLKHNSLWLKIICHAYTEVISKGYCHIWYEQYCREVPQLPPCPPLHVLHAQRDRRLRRLGQYVRLHRLSPGDTYLRHGDDILPFCEQGGGASGHRLLHRAAHGRCPLSMFPAASLRLHRPCQLSPRLRLPS